MLDLFAEWSYSSCDWTSGKTQRHLAPNGVSWWQRFIHIYSNQCDPFRRTIGLTLLPKVLTRRSGNSPNLLTRISFAMLASPTRRDGVSISYILWNRKHHNWIHWDPNGVTESDWLYLPDCFPIFDAFLINFPFCLEQRHLPNFDRVF